MSKVKINIKTADYKAPVVSAPIPIKIPIKVQIKEVKVPVVVPYDDIDDMDDIDWENMEEPTDSSPMPTPPPTVTQKIKPVANITVGNKILINIKPKSLASVPKVEEKKLTGATIVKVIIHKKPEVSKVTYISQILAQKPTKKQHIKIDTSKLNGIINIETFYDEGISYFVHWESGFIFAPDIDLEAKILPEPIGKVTDKPFNTDDCPDDKIPIKKRTIEWFYHFDMDADIIA